MRLDVSEVSAACSLALLVALTVSACRLGVRDRYIKREVFASELVGDWAPSPDSHSYLAWKKGGALELDEQVLALKSDGTCDVKGLGNSDGMPLPRLKSPDVSACHWRLEKSPTHVGHRPTEKMAVRVSVRQVRQPLPTFENATLFVAEERGRLLLWDWAEEPDRARYVTLERRR